MLEGTLGTDITDVRPIKRSLVTEVKEAAHSNTLSQPYVRQALPHTAKRTSHIITSEALLQRVLF